MQATPKPQSAAENSIAPVAPEPLANSSAELPARLFTPSTAIDDTMDVAGDTGEPANNAQEDAANEERLDLPSRSIILHNIWDPLEPQDNTAAFVEELEEDMRSECNKHGPVEHVMFRALLCLDWQ